MEVQVFVLLIRGRVRGVYTSFELLRAEVVKLPPAEQEEIDVGPFMLDEPVRSVGS